MEPTVKLSLLSLLIVLIAITPGMGAVTLSGTLKFMENATPGESVTFPITLSATEPSDYELTVLGFGNDNNGGYVGVTPEKDTSAQSARPYIKLSQSEVHIDIGKPVTVNAEVALPKNSVGGLYALINIHPKTVTNTGTSIVTAINIPVMITLTGTSIVESGIISNVTIGEDGVVTTTFTNTGNHHYYGLTNNIVSTNPSLKITKTADTAIVPGGNVVFVQKLNSTVFHEGNIVISEMVIKGKPPITTSPKTIGSGVVKNVARQPPSVQTTTQTELQTVNSDINDAVDKNTILAVIVFVISILGLGYFFLIRNKN